MTRPRRLRAVTDTERHVPLLEDLRPEWMTDAACDGYPTAWWFPESGSGRSDDAHYALAAAICRRCPVVDECAEWGRDEPAGMFGGTTPQERRRTPPRRRIPPAGIAHGTTTGYQTHGCRCDRCRQAHTDYRRRWRHDTTRPSFPHATESGYRYGCRCDPCRQAHADYRRKERR